MADKEFQKIKSLEDGSNLAIWFMDVLGDQTKYAELHAAYQAFLSAGEDQANDRLKAVLLDPATNSVGYNQDILLLASGARTTTQTSADLTNYNGRGISVVLDVTNIAAAPSVTVTINMKDTTSGKYKLLLAGAAVTTAVTNRYVVYPGLTAAANAVASDHLGRVFQIVVTANNANSGTYSVGYQILA